MEADRDRAIAQAMERQFQRQREAAWLMTFAAVLAVVVVIAALTVSG